MCTSHSCKPRSADDLRGELTQYLGALALQTLIVAVTIVGGVASGGLTLLADAPHAILDMGGFVISICVTVVALSRYRQLEALIRGYGGVANTMLLVGSLGLIVVETIKRYFQKPPVVNVHVLIGCAACALVLNIIQREKLRRFSIACHNGESMHTSLIAHSVLDICANAAAIASALVIGVTHNYRVDLYFTSAIVLIMSVFVYGLITNIRHEFRSHFT